MDFCDFRLWKCALYKRRLRSIHCLCNPVEGKLFKKPLPKLQQALLLWILRFRKVVQKKFYKIEDLKHEYVCEITL